MENHLTLNGLIHGVPFIAIKRGQWEYGQREQVIKQTAEIDGHDVGIWLEQEPGSGGLESGQASVKNLAGWKARLDRPTGDKEFRAGPLAAQVEVGNLYLKRGTGIGISLKKWNTSPTANIRTRLTRRRQDLPS